MLSRVLLCLHNQPCNSKEKTVSILYLHIFKSRSFKGRGHVNSSGISFLIEFWTTGVWGGGGKRRKGQRGYRVKDMRY